MVITSKDFHNWKLDSVTTVVMNELNRRKLIYTQGLVGGPRNDIENVNWYRGYLQAIEDILSLESIELEEVVENA